MADQSLCSIPGCGKSRQVRGYCENHYRRFLRYGNPMGGKTFGGEPLAFARKAISSETDECIIWPFFIARNGYGQLRADGKKTTPHRYVCEQHNGLAPSDLYEAAHECGDRRCINPRHLTWKTSKENAADRIRHGTHSRGEKNTQSKLTERDARMILGPLANQSLRTLAKRFDVSITAISYIRNRRNWAWVNPEASLTEAVD